MDGVVEAVDKILTVEMDGILEKVDKILSTKGADENDVDDIKPKRPEVSQFLSQDHRNLHKGRSR